MPGPCVAFQGRAHTGHGSAAGRTREPTFRAKHKSGPSVRGAPTYTEPASRVWTPGGCWGQRKCPEGTESLEVAAGGPARHGCGGEDVRRVKGSPPRGPRGTWGLFREALPPCGQKASGRRSPTSPEQSAHSARRDCFFPSEHRHISNAEAQSPTSPGPRSVAVLGQPLGPTARPPAPAGRAQLWELLLPGEPGFHWTKNARRVFDNRVLYL